MAGIPADRALELMLRGRSALKRSLGACSFSSAPPDHWYLVPAVRALAVGGCASVVLESLSVSAPADIRGASPGAAGCGMWRLAGYDGGGLRGAAARVIVTCWGLAGRAVSAPVECNRDRGVKCAGSGALCSCTGGGEGPRAGSGKRVVGISHPDKPLELWECCDATSSSACMRPACSKPSQGAAGHDAWRSAMQRCSPSKLAKRASSLLMTCACQHSTDRTTGHCTDGREPMQTCSSCT